MRVENCRKDTQARVCQQGLRNNLVFLGDTNFVATKDAAQIELRFQHDFAPGLNGPVLGRVAANGFFAAATGVEAPAGSRIKLEGFLKQGENPGEVVVTTEPHRSAKEWVRTALIGADGGVVYAMLKQPVSTVYDDWMMIAMPADTVALDQAWKEREKNPPAFEQVVVDTLRELAKLNPQSHVHAAELYSAVNVVYRCPPGPILGLLTSRPWFNHVGDLHFRYDDTTGS